MLFTREHPQPKIINFEDVQKIDCMQCNIVKANHTGECYLGDFFIMAKGIHGGNYKEWFGIFGDAKSFGICLASLFKCIERKANREYFKPLEVKEIPTEVTPLLETKAKFEQYIEESGITVAFAHDHTLTWFDKKDIKSIDCEICPIVKGGLKALENCFVADFYIMTAHINDENWEDVIETFNQPKSFRTCLRSVLDCMTERSTDVNFLSSPWG